MTKAGLMVLVSVLGLPACAHSNENPSPPAIETVASAFTQATTHDGHYISWKEHVIDAEDVNGGVPVRGGDGLAIGDLDGDGYDDIVTAQEDSNHLRVAFGTGDPTVWDNRTLAEGAVVGAIEDVAIGDFNGDGWLDLVVACEDAHLAYFQNPADQDKARDSSWESIIPPFSQGRGSWLRVFAADVNGDGRLDLTAANKGAADIVREGGGVPGSGATSLITLHGPPLEAGSWHEQLLFNEGIPNTALPFDIDDDGDLDILAAKRVKQELVIIENLGIAADGSVLTRPRQIIISPAFDAPPTWRALADAFQADLADLNGDGRVDIVLNGIELGDKVTPLGGLGWLEQPSTFDEPWRFHRIGNILPDWVTGIHLVDIDSDGDLDVMTGGYSGLNILAGAYSGASRDFDDPSVTAASSVGRLAWFENMEDAANWQRHDISRRVRGMYDMFETRDLDGDGDLDIIAPRGNSGTFDGVFWLEQIRSETPRSAFVAARADESRHLPLPPENWLSIYSRAKTDTAPNREHEID